MKKSSVIIIIVAVLLILAGGAAFTASLAASGWDFQRLDPAEYTDKSYKISDTFSDITIDTNTDNIAFIPCSEGENRVEYTDKTGLSHSVEIKDGALTVSTNEQRKWFDFIGIFSRKTEIKLYIPPEAYGHLKITCSTGNTVLPKEFCFENIDIKGSTGNVVCRADASQKSRIRLSTGNITVKNIKTKQLALITSTGNIRIEKATAEKDISIKVSTGNIYLKNISCAEFSSVGSTGDTEMSGLVCSGNLSIERSTGNIFLDGCDAKELRLKTSTGDIKGTLLSEKIFYADTSTGRIELPKTLSGGKCELKTSTGDIMLDIKNLAKAR